MTSDSIYWYDLHGYDLQATILVQIPDNFSQETVIKIDTLLLTVG